MSTLPQIYSLPSINKQPHRQGAIFGIHLLNSTAPLRNSLSSSLPHNQKDNFPHNPEQNASTTSRKLQYSLMNSTNKRKGGHRKNKSMFSTKNEKLSSSVIADALSYIQQSEQSNSVGAVSAHLVQSVKITKIVLKNDEEDLSRISKSMGSFQVQTETGLAYFSEKLMEKISTLRTQLSLMRRQTWMETKVNRKQVQSMTEQFDLLKEIMQTNTGKASFLENQCQL